LSAATAALIAWTATSTCLSSGLRVLSFWSHRLGDRSVRTSQFPLCAPLKRMTS
jgi:hypothetical protein